MVDGVAMTGHWRATRARGVADGRSHPSAFGELDNCAYSYLSPLTADEETCTVHLDVATWTPSADTNKITKQQPQSEEKAHNGAVLLGESLTTASRPPILPTFTLTIYEQFRPVTKHHDLWQSLCSYHSKNIDFDFAPHAIQQHALYDPLGPCIILYLQAMNSTQTTWNHTLNFIYTYGRYKPAIQLSGSPGYIFQATECIHAPSITGSTIIAGHSCICSSLTPIPQISAAVYGKAGRLFSTSARQHIL